MRNYPAEKMYARRVAENRADEIELTTDATIARAVGGVIHRAIGMANRFLFGGVGALRLELV